MRKRMGPLDLVSSESVRGYGPIARRKLNSSAGPQAGKQVFNFEDNWQHHAKRERSSDIAMSSNSVLRI